MIKNFISITKPGIIFGNLITVAGGFFLASAGQAKLFLLFITLAGISSIIAAGCVFNNIIDRDIDQIMERTKERVMVKGLLTKRIAFTYGAVLTVVGCTLLWVYANFLTVVVAVVGLFFYVVVYTLGFKRTSVHGTLIGSISGAIPPVVGYCAVTNQLDAGALILFLMLSIWQMPHSFAIAIFRFDDYLSAGIPVLPVKKGIYYAKVNMVLYVCFFTIISSLLTMFGYTGFYYLATSLAIGLWWVRLAIRGFKAENDRVWARKMFGFSIIAITILSIVMSLDALSVAL
ncbi:MAG: protoheme IX farnesyltransferase [Neisseriaceae bacterium]|nr:MAG: protoheme IX farnesyltransferase [Neisseriaceae bacterium]